MEQKFSRCVWLHITLSRVAQRAGNVTHVGCSKGCVRVSASQVLQNTSLVQPGCIHACLIKKGVACCGITHVLHGFKNRAEGAEGKSDGDKSRALQ